MRQCHALKSVVAFLPLPITLGNFFQNILPFVSNMCRTFYLTPLCLVLSNENSYHPCSVFGTLRVTISWFHIIAITFCLVINAVIIRQYHCTNLLDILCITWVQAVAEHFWYICFLGLLASVMDGS